MPQVSVRHSAIAFTVALAVWGSSSLPAMAQGASPLALAKPGVQTKVLAPLVGKWKRGGTKTPPMRDPLPFTGTQKCEWVATIWLSCDIADKHNAKDFPDVSGRLIVGWDFLHEGYRGFFVSAIGASVPLTGTYADDKLVLESAVPLKSPLGQMAMKLTLDLTDPRAPTFKDERSINRTPWFTLEETKLKR